MLAVLVCDPDAGWSLRQTDRRSMFLSESTCLTCETSTWERKWKGDLFFSVDQELDGAEDDLEALAVLPASQAMRFGCAPAHSVCSARVRPQGSHAHAHLHAPN